MKIFEIIEKLIEIKNIHGDIDVMMDNSNDDWGRL